MKAIYFSLLSLLLSNSLLSQGIFNFGIKTQLNHTIFLNRNENINNENLFSHDLQNIGAGISFLGSYSLKQLEFSVGLGNTKNQIGLRVDKLTNNNPQSFIRSSYNVNSFFADISLALPIFESNSSNNKLFATLSYQFLLSRVSGSQSNARIYEEIDLNYSSFNPDFESFYSQNVGFGVKLKSIIFNSKTIEFGLQYNYFLNLMPDFGIGLIHEQQYKAAIYSPQIQQISFSVAYWFRN